jgi:hypothetical protein
MDAILIVAPSMSPINKVKVSLKDKWKWIYVGQAVYILALKLERNHKLQTIQLSQEAYIEQILLHWRMLRRSQHPWKTPNWSSVPRA